MIHGAVGASNAYRSCAVLLKFASLSSEGEFYLPAAFGARGSAVWT